MPRRTTTSGGGRQRPSARGRNDDIPQVYRDMLAEADERAAKEPQTDRPLKRRKVGERSNVQSAGTEDAVPAPAEGVSTRQVQTTYDLDTSSDESDMEWEDIVIPEPGTGTQTNNNAVTNEGLQITLDKSDDKPKATVKRRKPVGASEKSLRLVIHKVHVLCLLSHVSIRNIWCNDDEIQTFLKQMLTRKVIGNLNPRETMLQFNRSTTFIDGLKQASEAFARRFKVTAPGLRRPHWVDAQDCRDRAEAIMREAEMFLSREDYRTQARKLEGSRDFGAQLFCALLRSAAVEARLVCSIQALPFSGVANELVPEKPKRQYIVISSDDHASSSDDLSGLQPNRTKRLSQPQFKKTVPSSSSYTGKPLYFRNQHILTLIERPRHFASSSYPIFWVEAFNEAVQKWVPVDPLVTKSVAKHTRFEPPTSDRLNNMSYVVAFEEDASARDVTRRYAKAFNAKTRKTRVESTKHGERWWATVMGHFEKPFLEDRDEVELSELTAKSAAEPMPKNIQDFKDHPIYALERHLRQNQVIHPKRVTGQVEVTKPGSKQRILEPVYRRADVHVVRSADGWYRHGRDIKLGEQPLKRATARTPKNELEGEFDNTAAKEYPLYAIHQTEIYRPPPVVKGRIPKNAFGNLDIYVPTMIPSGGFHLKHPAAIQAARVLGIDYAEAVTGFKFNGSRGIGVFNGIIVACEYREALEEVIRCMEDEKAEAEEERKSQEALRLWKLFLLKLRIAEKVKRYVFEGEESEDVENVQHSDDDYDGETDEPGSEGGGFLPDSDKGIAQPTSLSRDEKFAPNTNTGDIPAGDGGGFIRDDEEIDGGGFMAESENDDALEPAPVDAIIQPTSTLMKPKSNVPRYQLTVIPNTKKSGTVSDRPSDSTKASKRDPQVKETAQENNAPVDDGRQFSNDVSAVVDTSTWLVPTSESVEAISLVESKPASRVPSPVEVEGDSDSDIEKVSLLSHDPEDEDAEPDWLMSD
ncbi:hypothetical protein BGW36DRAFT_390908 [Talaromyces proteolyticus]|uniref:Rad4-domain-containing protein n=1 Tax=Talaromyces proteolyticus TaxID=1131652 RepID=A0AAD4KDU6_9EURO|nr:uncharacterized protein BGW36DRAFT_390908 [Talaromyces proteolyticus]KAH8689464.1 hypothetical protein BGW36DRAFT_390908 [Talaromyces proteolyticus]